MKVSKTFMKDFAYLANLYGWLPADIEEIKECTRSSPEAMQRYWSILAAAHRSGYAQTPENGYIRLREWCKQRGFPNPYVPIDRGGNASSPSA